MGGTRRHHHRRSLLRRLDCAAASDGFTGQGVVTLVCAALFWLSLMVLAAAAVQKGVDRYRSGADPDHRERR